MIAATLRKAGIPFTKSQKKDDAPWEVMTFCGLLVSIQTNDSLGLRQTLHAIGLSDKTVKVIHDAMGDEMFSLMDGECPVTEELPLEERKVLEEFMILSRNWRRLTAKGHYSHVVEAIGIYFLDQVVRGDDAKDDFESFVNILSRKATGSLQKRVMNFFNKEDKKSSAGVSLYTMHASKGLEFDRVFVAQCNSGTIPSAKSTSVEEERRLFYVAMTRARNDLTMSYISTKGRSPFLTESGVDLG
jgi:superfamily I DNA/RNA helicase